MYTEQDLEAAVGAGAISADAARALRAHVAASQPAPSADEEQFRLITGFNDIFVSIAAIILLGAVWWIGQSINVGIAGALVAAIAWGLAEYFTRVRRMALPSIILLLAFVGGVFIVPTALIMGFGVASVGTLDTKLLPIFWAGAALVTAGAAWLHWRRFMVPITVAAGTAAVVAAVIALTLAALRIDFRDDGGQGQAVLLALILSGGIGVFGLAMTWDSRDTRRETRRSDVAFWLHLLSAPMIAHSLFSLLGVTTSGAISIGGALGVIALYIAFGVIALAIDRRALLVSALAYVLFAMTQLFQQFGAVEFNVALTALIIGASLLLLSAFWQRARRVIVATLPDTLRKLVPAPGMVAHSA